MISNALFLGVTKITCLLCCLDLSFTGTVDKPKVNKESFAFCYVPAWSLTRSWQNVKCETYSQNYLPGSESPSRKVGGELHLKRKLGSTTVTSGQNSLF